MVDSDPMFVLRVPLSLSMLPTLPVKLSRNSFKKLFGAVYCGPPRKGAELLSLQNYSHLIQVKPGITYKGDCATVGDRTIP